MRVDFRREHQIAWSKAECQRLQATFGDLVDVTCHIVEDELSAGKRVMTVSDPGGSGLSAAVCIVDSSAEGMYWQAALIPVTDHDESWDIPESRPIQSIKLEIRYGRCVHATWNNKVGEVSGANDVPDFSAGIMALIAGKVKARGLAHPKPYAA